MPKRSPTKANYYPTSAQPSSALFAGVPSIGVLGNSWTGFGVFGALATTACALPFDPLSEAVPITCGPVGGGGDCPSFSPAPLRLRLYFFKDMTPMTASAIITTLPTIPPVIVPAGRRVEALYGMAGALAPPLLLLLWVVDAEEEAVMNDFEEIVFGISDRGVARSSLTRM
ncbi:hypothetical protein DL767_004344 [Monosporascus sp. MG133]|nr:hypothetical protein DL767_004344 [Monosporascus sp. MG133]